MSVCDECSERYICPTPCWAVITEIFNKNNNLNNKIMELKHTVSLMLSSDYKERFIAEYLQVKIRYEKLLDMCKKWDEGTLPFTPTCSRQVYTDQLNHMKAYLSILEARAITEGIDVSEETLVHRTDYVPRVKELRQLGDHLVQAVKELFESHEVCTSIDKFLEGIMWLGMELKRINEPNPYPNSKDPGTGDVIDKTADNLKM